MALYGPLDLRGPSLCEREVCWPTFFPAPLAMQNGTLGSLIYLLRMVIFHSKLLVYQRVEVTLIDIGPRKRPRRHHLASNPGAWRAGLLLETGSVEGSWGAQYMAFIWEYRCKYWLQCMMIVPWASNHVLKMLLQGQYHAEDLWGMDFKIC